MNLVKRVSLLIVGFWALAIVSCIDCPPIRGVYFDVKGMDIQEYRANGTPIQANEELVFSDLVMLTVFNVNYYSLNKRVGLMNPAYALSCEENGERGSKEILKDIVVQTVNDFNSKYQAGDTINDIISVKVFGIIAPLNGFLQRDSMRVSYDGFGMVLNEAPTNHLSKFRTTLTLTNGEKYVAETVNLLIN